MRVRNFYLDAEIDGRSTRLTGGPQSKDGGFYLSVKQRSNNAVTTPLVVEGEADENGELLLRIWYNGELITKHRTKR